MLTSPFRILAVLFAAICVAPASAQTGWAPSETPPRVMPDPAHYCTLLSEQVATEQRLRPIQSADIRTLAIEGRRMCDRGHYKGGLVRLRSALRLLRGE
jgi:hypothetical protein